MKKLLLAACAALLAPILPTHAGFTSNQSATSLLGQPDFSGNSFNGTVTAATLASTEGCAFDPVSGKLFVSDSLSNRVLRYASADAFVTGSPAEAVFGQPDLTSNLASSGTANGLSYPAGLYLDGEGRLWVADYYNGRVLRFDRAATKASGANADGILGQPDFTSVRPTPFVPASASQLYDPVSVTGDAAGRIWVTDQSRSRILRWDNAAKKANGANANAVLGQPDFVSQGTALSRSGFDLPWGMSVDSAGRLWVADTNNNRVLRFNAAASKANGANADAVLGQPDFLTANTSLTATGLKSPYAVTADPAGNVWVSDTGNGRLLGFNKAATKTNGAAADLVIGQKDFTTRAYGFDPNRLLGPAQVTFAAPGTFFVSDYQAARVLRFGPRVFPAPTLKSPSKATARNGTVTLKGTSTNATRVTYRVGPTGAFKPATGPAANWTIKLTKLAAGKTHRVTITATNSSGQTTQTTVTVKSL